MLNLPSLLSHPAVSHPTASCIHHIWTCHIPILHPAISKYCTPPYPLIAPCCTDQTHLLDSFCTNESVQHPLSTVAVMIRYSEDDNNGEVRRSVRKWRSEVRTWRTPWLGSASSHGRMPSGPPFSRWAGCNGWCHGTVAPDRSPPGPQSLWAGGAFWRRPMGRWQASRTARLQIRRRGFGRILTKIHGNMVRTLTENEYFKHSQHTHRRSRSRNTIPRATLKNNEKSKGLRFEAQSLFSVICHSALQFQCLLLSTLMYPQRSRCSTKKHSI